MSAAFTREEARKMQARAAKSTIRFNSLQNSGELKRKDSGLVTQLQDIMERSEHKIGSKQPKSKAHIKEQTQNYRTVLDA